MKGYWLIQNSGEVSDLVSKAYSKGSVTSIRMYNFSSIYTNLPHAELKECIPSQLVKVLRATTRSILVQTEISGQLDQYQKTKHAPFNAPGNYKMLPFSSTMCTFKLAIVFSNSVLVSPWALTALPCSQTCCCMITKAQLGSFSPGEVRNPSLSFSV